MRILSKIFVISFVTICNTIFSQQKIGNKCENILLEYLNSMEVVKSPTKNQVYHIHYTTNTIFFQGKGLPNVSTETDILIGENKIVIEDNNMKVYGDDKHMFVVLPKAKTIYWNKSDVTVYEQSNSHQKFLDVERVLLKTSKDIKCLSNNNVSVIPSDEFKKNIGLIEQNIKLDLNKKRVSSVENIYNSKSKIKRQVVDYAVVNYNSSKKIKKSTDYIFNGTSLLSVYEGYEIVDNR